MGAWIEIRMEFLARTIFGWSHPTMGAWIEIVYQLIIAFVKIGSHPTMGAWIEIRYTERISRLCKVAPHDGCVD